MRGLEYLVLAVHAAPLTLQGQQAHEEDAGRGAASEERVGADHQESFEEPERPQLG